jgi:hypothetical protein
MFWGCFTYKKKGPCHYWAPETAKEKAAAKEEIEKINKELEPLMKELWELNNRIRRLKLRQLPSKKPKWKWKKENGKLARGSGKGIN